MVCHPEESRDHGSERQEGKDEVNRNSLRPIYSTLAGEERYGLAAQIGAGGDTGELMHVLRSVPDPSFSEPAMASFRLAMAFARAAGPYLGWLQLVEMLEGLLTGERGRAVLPPDAQLPVAMVLDRAAEGAARDLRALRGALGEVCRTRAKLSPQVLLALWAPEVAAGLGDSEGWIGNVDADPATAERFRAGLDLAWTLSLQLEGE